MLTTSDVPILVRCLPARSPNHCIVAMSTGPGAALPPAGRLHQLRPARIRMVEIEDSAGTGIQVEDVDRIRVYTGPKAELSRVFKHMV